MKIIRGRLSPSQLTPTNLRYNPDTDTVEFSPDGGTTWNPSPENDPRHGAQWLKPPLTGGSAQCDAAANMVKWLKDFIDQATTALIELGTIFQIVNMLLDYLTLLTEGAALLLDLISEAASTLFGLGGAALAGAFSGTEYDDLLCIFFCNMSAEGQVDATQLARIESDVTSGLNATAAFVVNLILAIQGEIGLSNAGTIGGQTGDCTACECTFTYCFDFVAGDQSGAGWDVIAPYGQYTPGQGWRTLIPNGLILQLDLPSAHEVTRIAWDGTFFTGGGPNGQGTYWRASGANLFVDSGSIGGVPYSIESTGDYTIDQIWLNPYGGSTADIYIQHCNVTSKTEIPEWSSYLC